MHKNNNSNRKCFENNYDGSASACHIDQKRKQTSAFLLTNIQRA